MYIAHIILSDCAHVQKLLTLAYTTVCPEVYMHFNFIVCCLLLQIADRFQLTSLTDRRWQIQPCCALKGEGIQVRDGMYIQCMYMNTHTSMYLYEGLPSTKFMYSTGKVIYFAYSLCWYMYMYLSTNTCI